MSAHLGDSSTTAESVPWRHARISSAGPTPACVQALPATLRQDGSVVVERPGRPPVVLVRAPEGTFATQEPQDSFIQSLRLHSEPPIRRGAAPRSPKSVDLSAHSSAQQPKEQQAEPLPLELEQPPPTALRPTEWDSEVPVPADGLCTLSGVIATDPQAVHAVLNRPGRSAGEVQALNWLLDPEAVRTSLSRPYGSASANLSITRAMLIRYLAHEYLGNRGIGDLPHGLAAAMGHGGAHDLPAVPGRMSVSELRGAVLNWRNRWSGDVGELFLHLLGHALDRNMRVYQPDIPNPTEQFAVAGPSGSQPLRLFRHPGHINASAQHPLAPYVPRPTVQPRPTLPSIPTHEPLTPIHETTILPHQPLATIHEEEEPHVPAPIVGTTPHTDVTDTSAIIAAPKPLDLESKPLPALPKLTADHTQLSYSDLVKGFVETDEDHVINAIGSQFEGVLSKSDWNAVRGELGKLKLNALTTRLTHLGHGETDSITIDRSRLRGKITFRAAISDTQEIGTVSKVEAEGGYDHYVASMESATRLWRYYVNLGDKEALDKTSVFTSGARLGGDKTRGLVFTSSVRSFTRGKTVEDHLAVASTARIEIDLSGLTLQDGRSPVAAGLVDKTVNADLHPVVLVAKADVPGSGVKSKDTSFYRPPKVVESTKALTGLALPRDVFNIDEAGRRIAGGLGTALNRAFRFEVPDRMTPYRAGRELFGSDWPAVREEMLEQIDLNWVYTHLIDLTSGKPVGIAFDAVPGSGVRITADIDSMTHDRNTDQTEFNVGSHWTNTAGNLKGKGRSAGFNFNFKQKPLGDTPAVGGLGLSGGGARSGTAQSTESSLSGTAVKSKKEGAAFDLKLTLAFEFYRPDSAHPKSEPQPTATGHTVLGGKVLYPAGLSQKVAAKPDAVWTPESAPLVPAKTSAEPVWYPKIPDGAAHGLDGVGLPMGSVVFDVLGRDIPADASPLDDVLREQGSELLGGSTWNEVEPSALNGFGKNALETALPGMTRGQTLRGTRLPRVFKGGWARPHATARLTKLEYVDSWDSAESQYLNEHGSGNAWRGRHALTASANILGGGVKDFDDSESSVNPAGMAGHTVRTRVATRLDERSVSVDNIKFSEPMALFKGEAEVPVSFLTQRRGGASASSSSAGKAATVEFLVLVPKSELAQYAYERVPGGLSADAPPPTESGTVTPHAPVVGPGAPVQVTQHGQLRFSDTVVGLTRNTILPDLEGVLVEGGMKGHGLTDTLDHFATVFDDGTLTARLPAMTKGESWGDIHTSGDFTTEVVITRVDPQADSFHPVGKGTAEFETGDSSTVSRGIQRDREKHNAVSLYGQLKTVHARVTGTLERSYDANTGHSADETGEFKGRTKFKTGTVRFDANFGVHMKITVWRNNRGLEWNPHSGLLSSKMVREDVPAEIGGRVVTAEWDQPGASATQAPRHVPRIEQQKVLGPEDSVIDVWGSSKGKGTEAILDGLDESGLKAYRGNALRWASAKSELADKMTPSKFKQNMRPMMHGRPWEVILKDGTRFEFTSSVDRSTWVSDVNESETEVGGSRSTVLGHSSAAGKSHTLNVQVLGTTDHTGVSPIYGQVGATGEHGFGHLKNETGTVIHTAGSSLKTKEVADQKMDTPGGSVFDGVGLLHAKITRPRGVDHFFSARLAESGEDGLLHWPSRTTVGDAQYNLRYLVHGPDSVLVREPAVDESASTEAVEADNATAPVIVPPVEELVSVKLPPAGIWDEPQSDMVVLTTSGSGSLMSLVNHGGESAFGKAWDSKRLDGRTHSQAVGQQFSQQLLTNSHAKLWGKQEVDTGWFFTGRGWGKVVGEFELVNLHYDDMHAKADSLLTRRYGERQGRSKLTSKRWGGAIVGGVKADPLGHTDGGYGEFNLSVGGAWQGSRESGPSEQSRMFGNARIPGGMANYLAGFRGSLRFYRGLTDRDPLTESGVFPLRLSVPLDRGTGEVTLPKATVNRFYFDRDHPDGALHGAEDAGTDMDTELDETASIATTPLETHTDTEPSDDGHASVLGIAPHSVDEDVFDPTHVEAPPTDDHLADWLQWQSVEDWSNPVGHAEHTESLSVPDLEAVSKHSPVTEHGNDAVVHSDEQHSQLAPKSTSTVATLKSEPTILDEDALRLPAPIEYESPWRRSTACATVNGQLACVDVAVLILRTEPRP